MKYKVLRQQTAVNQVIEEMKRLVANGSFKSMQMLPSENTLAEWFDVSRPTVRQANKILTYLGILKSESGKGTILSDRDHFSTEALAWSVFLKSNDLSQLIELRNIIEEHSIESLIDEAESNARHYNSVVVELEMHINRMKKALVSNSSPDLINADFDFHKTIILSNNNTLIKIIFNTLKFFLNSEITAALAKSRNIKYCFDLHEEIFTQIKECRKKEALIVLHQHMKTLMESFE